MADTDATREIRVRLSGIAVKTRQATSKHCFTRLTTAVLDRLDAALTVRRSEPLIRGRMAALAEAPRARKYGKPVGTRSCRVL